MFAVVLAVAVLAATSGHPAVARARGLLDVQVTVPLVVVERVSGPGNAEIRRRGLSGIGRGFS